MQASLLDLDDSSMPRFEWPLNSPSTDTTASLSPSKEKLLTDRIQNLELIVSNLLTRIIDLEKTKYENEILNKNWSSETKNALTEKTKLTRSKSSFATYFAKRSG
tara:strand:- start:9564 stop:9878 length:315 start_codon:yes stop_codon:yes gene_type:complete